MHSFALFPKICVNISCSLILLVSFNHFLSLEFQKAVDAEAETVDAVA